MTIVTYIGVALIFTGIGCLIGAGFNSASRTDVSNECDRLRTALCSAAARLLAAGRNEDAEAAYKAAEGRDGVAA